MYCRICGTEDGIQYYLKKRQSLCRDCAKETPNKVGRATFDKIYWRNEGDVPESTKREFYDDYLHSTYGSVASYMKATCSPLR